MCVIPCKLVFHVPYVCRVQAMSLISHVLLLCAVYTIYRAKRESGICTIRSRKGVFNYQYRNILCIATYNSTLQTFQKDPQLLRLGQAIHDVVLLPLTVAQILHDPIHGRLVSLECQMSWTLTLYITWYWHEKYSDMWTYCTSLPSFRWIGEV